LFKCSTEQIVNQSIFQVPVISSHSRQRTQDIMVWPIYFFKTEHLFCIGWVQVQITTAMSHWNHSDGEKVVGHDKNITNVLSCIEW